MNQKIRVRFAPSPTGGLHLGGVRTVLYNYLFARQSGGDFILRIEDTDQSRFVEGAEQYINDCLAWCGLTPDESPEKGGPYAPYRQSERKYLYYEHAQRLVDAGYAYYAFDTPAELEHMRNTWRNTETPNPQYDYTMRMRMRNSLSLDKDKVMKLLGDGTPYVIRIKMPDNFKIKFNDLIRGEIAFDSNVVDDKVLLKADGMPTYHLAVVVDDYLMKITHALRGEEWLPSTPVHLLLWEYLGWKEHMPQYAHLPLILKPDGNGKLSKRDGDRLGFPVFAMNWKDPRNEDLTIGFREMGFLPEAFINMLAMLGWNDGTEQELFSLEELVAKFSMGRVHKGGAKFDFEKAKWFNHQYIQRADTERLSKLVRPYFEEKKFSPAEELLQKVIGIIKERCTYLSDFWREGSFFFMPPESIDEAAIKDKWNEQKKNFFQQWISSLSALPEWNHTTIEQSFNELLAVQGLKKGDAMMPFRIMLVGAKHGPGVFMIAEIIGKQDTVSRIKSVIEKL